MRRVGVQRRAAADDGGARGREAVVRKYRVAAVAATSARSGNRTVSRAERPRLVFAAISRTIRAPILPHVAGVRGHRASLPQ